MLTPVGATVAQYWNAIKAGNPTHVRMVFPAQGITIDDQDIDVSRGMEISDVLNGDSDLVFGKAVSKQVNVSIINTLRVLNMAWTEEFRLDMGVEINSVTNWVTVGYFVGSKPTMTSASSVEFVAYDRMGLFDKSAEDYLNGIEYPASLEDIYHGLCDFVGITYEAGHELPNIMSRVFEEAPFDSRGVLCRDVLSWIAEACGCYARISAAGNVQLVWYQDHTSYAITGDDEFHVEANNTWGMIWDEFDTYIWNMADLFKWNEVCSYEEVYNVDAVKVSQINDGIDVYYPNMDAGNIYQIVDNPYLVIGDSDDVDDYVIPLYDRLNTFGGHLPVNVDCVGNWLVEAGDVITVSIEDKTISAPVYIRTLRWNGSIHDEYETTGNIVRQQYVGSAREKAMQNNTIRMFVKGKYYDRQSGIEINEDGVEIIAGRYLKLASGGVLDVESDNFKLNSAEKKMVSGSWQFNDDGIKFENDSVIFPFYIGKRNNSDIIPKDKPGLYYFTESNVGGIQLYACSKQNNTPYSASLELYTIYNSSLGKRVHTLYLFDNSEDTNYISNLGQQFLPITYGYFGTINGNKYVYISGLIYMYPRDVANSYIAFQEYTYNSAHYTKIYGSIGANMIFEGQHTAPSSREIKHDIKDLDDQGETIDKLNPVSFVYDNDPGEQKHYGLIYEDTIKVIPEVCTGDEGSKAINYVELVPILLKEIQDLRKRVSELESRMEGN